MQAASTRPSILYSWFTPVTRLKGVGPNIADALARLLVNNRTADLGERTTPTLRDLLFHLPTGVIDRTRLTPIAQLQAGSYATIEALVTEHAAPPPRRRAPYRVSVEDASGSALLVFYNVKGDYLTKQLPVGERCLISGMVEMRDGIASIAHPDNIALAGQAAVELKLVPTYPLTYAISHKTVARLTSQALSQVRLLPEWLDDAFMKTQQLPSITEALTALHQPQSEAVLQPDSAPRRRLAYDELLANQLALAIARISQKRAPAPPIPFHAPTHEALLAALPFQLTAGQREVFAQLCADIASGERMVRLLQGDVGSGKTILAFAIMAQVVASGRQACLMAPTDLLARQHLATLQPLAEKLGFSLALLSGKMKKAEANAVRAQIADGRIQMAIGTHALFQDDVAFANLGLVVVDEQHRFGVGQRMRLTAKGDTPHLLQMTATPIPRSMAMTVYGDMDVSSLTERPPGRKEIDTRVVPEARLDEVIAALKRVVAAGEKIYWVCPLIEQSDDPDLAALDLTAVQDRFTLLQTHFPDKVALMHGRMKLAEREKTMQDFAFGDVQILVATTVVEVGVNVPEATVMVIEHAERFGLAQMHQLRGRVGRSDLPSRCVLLYHRRLSEVSKARLNILRETNDGFVIAEEDLRLRGAGDMLGTRQTGLPDFKLADLSVHLPLIRTAHDDVKLIMHRDAELRSPRGQALRVLLALFDYDGAVAQLREI